jgi:hypothetical protein
MSEMSVTAGAADFRPIHSMASVFMKNDVFFGDRRPEAWPSGMGIEFSIGTEEGRIATDATIDSGIGAIVPGNRKRPLGSVFSRDLVGKGRQHPFPVRIVFDPRDSFPSKIVSVVGKCDDNHLFLTLMLI